MNELELKEFKSFKPLDIVIHEVHKFICTISDLTEIVKSDKGANIIGNEISAQIIVDGSLSTDILQFPNDGIPSCEIRIFYKMNDKSDLLKLGLRELSNFLIAFSDDELKYIYASMPLLSEVPSKVTQSSLNEFAIIWRDHFLEENVPLLLGLEKLGVKPKWIFALSKGDKTIKRHRITAFFKERGYYDVATLPNLISETEGNSEEIYAVVGRIRHFISIARKNSKRIMLIDDGGMLSKYFFNEQNSFDCALEVTIVGIRKLLNMNKLQIPIYDLGRCELKTKITYKEIALSCVNRIRELIPGEKFIGRPILILGYGSAGSHVAKLFRDIGAHIAVVDIDIIKLIEAEENGIYTYRNCADAINKFRPFLVVGCSGEVSLMHSDYMLLPNNAYVTGIATKDLEALRSNNKLMSKWIANRGFIHRTNHKKCFIQLGDGQSINLFESEAIPNRANDIFKSGILIAAADLSCRFDKLEPGIHLDHVDRILRSSGLYDDYYNLYYNRL